jgi:hypothetical protein
MLDLTLNSTQNHDVAPIQASMSPIYGSQYSSMQDPALNNVESHAVAPTQTTTLTELELQRLAVGDLATGGVEKHVAGLVQAPTVAESEPQPPSVGEELATGAVERHVAAQALMPTKCDLCSEKVRLCDGNQENGKSCTACYRSKRPCSFVPRKYGCEFCDRHFIRQCDLSAHIKKNHKKPSLKAPKKSGSSGDTPKPLRQLQKDSPQSTPTGDTSRPSKRARRDTKKQRYGNIGDLLSKVDRI